MRNITLVLLAVFMFTASITAQNGSSHKEFVGKWKSEKFKDNIITITEQNGKFNAVFSVNDSKLEILICKPISEYGVYMIRLSWRNKATDYKGSGDLELESADRMKLITSNPYASSNYNLGSTKPNVNIEYYKRLLE